MNATEFLQKPRSVRLGILDQSVIVTPPAKPRIKPPRLLSAHERMLDAIVEGVPAGALVIAEMDVDGEFTAVTITRVRI